MITSTSLFLLFPLSILFVLGFALLWGELIVVVGGHCSEVWRKGCARDKTVTILGGLCQTPTSSSAQDSRVRTWLRRMHSPILRCAARFLTGLKAFHKALKSHPDGEGERTIQHCRTSQIHNQRAERRMWRVYLEDGQEGRAD